jgi:L-rhamnose-H+ transport protein
LCFAYAILRLGMALSFAVNLSLAVTLGSMFVIFYKSLVFSVEDVIVILAILLIIISLGLSYFSGKKISVRNKNPSNIIIRVGC